jgi:hypothetical protein
VVRHLQRRRRRPCYPPPPPSPVRSGVPTQGPGRGTVEEGAQAARRLAASCEGYGHVGPDR